MTNAFDYSGPSRFSKELERNAQNSRKGAKMVEKLRAQGKEPMAINLSNRVEPFRKPTKESKP